MLGRGSNGQGCHSVTCTRYPIHSFHIFKHTFPRMRSFLLLQLLVLKDALSVQCVATDINRLIAAMGLKLSEH